MKGSALKCLYCGNLFFPSKFRPQQRVCSEASCQPQRRREYHRAKLAQDPEYRAICRDSQKKWQERHPDYQRQYRERHPEYVRRNRALQRASKTRNALDSRPIETIYRLGMEKG